jgi:hypothetical protein
LALKFAVNNSLSAITTLPSSISGGALNLISTQTASASASLEFSLDDSYDSYIFKFYNIHPSDYSINFRFNLSTDNGSTYSVTKTTTVFRAVHFENDSTAFLSYDGGQDLAQSTADQGIGGGLDNSADANLNGTLQLYNPSNNTFVKHFIARTNFSAPEGGCYGFFVAGYGNTTSPINSIKFLMQTGNIDDGIIKMYGVS